MKRTEFKDVLVGRIGICSIALLQAFVIDSILFQDIPLEIRIPAVLFVSLCLTFFLLWLMDQLNPVLESIYKVIFTYNDNIVASEEATEWCKNNASFWHFFNGKYYFLFKRDAMAFKLAWL